MRAVLSPLLVASAPSGDCALQVSASKPRRPRRCGPFMVGGFGRGVSFGCQNLGQLYWRESSGCSRRTSPVDLGAIPLAIRLSGVCSSRPVSQERSVSDTVFESVVILIFGTVLGMDAGCIPRFEVSLRTSLTIHARALTCSYRVDRLWANVWLYVWAYERAYTRRC